MKKTLFTAMLAMASVAVADELKIYNIDAEDWALPASATSPYVTTLGEGESLDLTADWWNVSVTLTLNPAKGYNEWGTTVFATGTDVAATSYGDGGFQMWVGKGGNVVVKGNDFDNNSYGTTLSVVGGSITEGTYTFGVEKKYNETTFYVLNSTGTKVASSTKTITDWTGSVNTFCTAAGLGNATDANGWSMPVATITVPEPTTATLSLLALAGLAARRRRR